MRVEKCPYCGARHAYVVEITLQADPDAPSSLVRAQILVACAVDGRSFRTQVDVTVGARQTFVAAHFARYDLSA